MNNRSHSCKNLKLFSHLNVVDIDRSIYQFLKDNILQGKYTVLKWKSLLYKAKPIRECGLKIHVILLLIQTFFKRVVIYVMVLLNNSNTTVIIYRYKSLLSYFGSF